jgi:hypothetical protein
VVTEQEAKQKWCPQARAGIGKFVDPDQSSDWTQNNVPGINAASIIGRQKPVIYLHKCIGSECMAWRWCEKQDGYEVPMVGEVEDRKGYCGAYGKPEYD